MYDKHIIYPNSLHNLADGSGFALGVRLPYYRGQPLSVVEDIAVKVDGEAVPREQVRFSVRGKTWTLDQLEENTHERWEFGEVAEVSVLRPQGLTSGEHDVAVGLGVELAEGGGEAVGVRRVPVVAPHVQVLDGELPHLGVLRPEAGRADHGRRVGQRRRDVGAEVVGSGLQLREGHGQRPPGQPV